jgi:type IX secretion system PorP/SprF family membrane protein
MNYSIRKVFILLTILFSQSIYSQEGLPIYTDYLTENYYLLHPSMAGVNLDGIKIRMTARKNWLDQVNAPNLQTLSVDARLTERSGVGAIIFKDENGYNSQTGVSLTYAHHINFNEDRARMNEPDLFNYGSINQFSFGLSIGGVQNSLDQTSFDQFNIYGQQDPLISKINQSSGYFNMDVGASYVNYNYFIHLTFKNILFTPSNIYGDEVYDFSKNYTSFLKYVASFGYLFFTETPFSFEPSVLFHGSKLTSEKNLDLNFKSYYDLDYGYLWLGISYRQSFDGAQYLDGEQIKNQTYQLITPIFGVSYKDFVFSYNYSYQQGNIIFGTGGFHQITLGYNIDLFN